MMKGGGWRRGGGGERGEKKKLKKLKNKNKKNLNKGYCLVVVVSSLPLPCGRRSPPASATTPPAGDLLPLPPPLGNPTAVLTSWRTIPPFLRFPPRPRRRRRRGGGEASTPF